MYKVIGVGRDSERLGGTWGASVYFWGQLTPTAKDIPEPSHGRVFRDKCHSFYVVKSV